MVTKYYYSKPVMIGTIITNEFKARWKELKNGRRYTMAAVYNEDDGTIKLGVSICQEIDNFNKVIGKQLAFENAITKPFHVISDFDGVRNKYADKVMELFIDKEKSLNKKFYSL